MEEKKVIMKKKISSNVKRKRSEEKENQGCFYREVKVPLVIFPLVHVCDNSSTRAY